MPPDPAHLTNPEHTRADFTYSITPTKLTIRDTGKGEKSVLEDLATVIRKIEYWHQGSVDHLELTILGPDSKEVSR